jgi:Gamma-glutamyl cyclotransferase, AIG2-like
MMERRVDVFFYGLFMDADALRSKGLHPYDVRQARVDGMALRLGDRATLVPDAAASVHGVLMGLSHSELDRLYAESTVQAYRPEPVIAKLAEGALVAALCFNLPAPPERDQGNPEYAVKLQAVARRLGLPEDYVVGIR